MITGRTRLTGLLGSPVAHSVSPLMHNEAFQMLNLDYAYLCFDIKEEQMEDAVKALKLLNVRGFNCTMPDKIRMFELADRLTPAAELIGAVNTVVNEDGEFVGYNTDGVGFVEAVKDCGYDIKGKKMTILGAGGAATAMAVQAALDGVKELAIFNRKSRSWNRGQQLVDNINAKTECKAVLYDLDDENMLRQQTADSYILVNGTPSGMAPNTDATPISDVTMLHEGLIIYDAIYNPRETRLMKEGRDRGCKVHNGMYMLLYQGAEAFRLWTGQKMPVEEIKKKYFV